jgi:hypothetical protein
MRRTNLTEATMQGWKRLDDIERHRFFERFLEAALRLDALALRAWLRRRLRQAPLSVGFDPATLQLSDDDLRQLAKGQ